MKKMVLLVLLVLSTALAAQNAGEIRTHYVISDRSRVPMFYVTAIQAGDEHLSSDVYLIRDARTGRRLTVDVETNYKTHETTGQYTLDNQHTAKVHLQMPFVAATTLHETIEEGKKYRELWDADIPITVEARGRSERTTEKTWKNGATSGDAHRRVTNALDADLAAAVKSALPVLSFPTLHAACPTIELVAD